MILGQAVLQAIGIRTVRINPPTVRTPALPLLLTLYTLSNGERRYSNTIIEGAGVYCGTDTDDTCIGEVDVSKYT